MTTLISSEPLFYGDDPYNNRGSSAEDFITKMDNWAVAEEWNDVVKTAQAKGFLRDEAANYYKFVLKCENKVEHTQVTAGDWNVFARVFKRQYFKFRTTMDLSADWSLLKQGPKEKAYKFAGRVGGTMVQYSGMLPAMPISAADHTRIHDLILVLGDNANALRALWAMIDTVLEEHRIAAQEVAYFDLGYKVLANGMRNQTLVSKVRAQERSGLAYGRILPYLEQEEANMTNGVKPVDNTAAKTYLPNANGKVTAIGDGEVDDNGQTMEEAMESAMDAAVEAVKAKFRRGKPNGNGNQAKKTGNGNGNGNGNGKGRGKSTQNQTQQQANPGKQNAPAQNFNGARPRFDPNRPPPGPCNICKRTGHWQKDCPKAQQFAKFLEENGQINAQSDKPADESRKTMEIAFQNFLNFQHQNQVAEIDSKPFKGKAYDSLNQSGSGKGRAEM